jgi:hypothetical protein
VVGAPHTPGTAPDVIERINAAIAAAAAAAGVTFVDPAGENWTDPADPASGPMSCTPTMSGTSGSPTR